MTAHFALHAVEEALLQAGLAASELDASRVGVCIGTSVGASLNLLISIGVPERGRHPTLNPCTDISTPIRP